MCIHHYLHWVGLCSSLVFWIFIRLHHVFCILPLHIQTFVEAKTCAWKKKTETSVWKEISIYQDRKVKPKHFCSNETSVQLCKKQTWVCWGLIGPPVTQRHACFPLLLPLLCICNSRRCCSPHFLNSLKNKTAIITSALILFPIFFGNMSLPFRKQCQAVEGQEWDHPMSSSSDRDDMQKTDSDSLLACTQT